MKAVKSNPDPSGVAFQPIKLMRSSTGVCLNGFFVFHALPYSVREILGPQVGPLGKKPRHGMQPCD